MKIDGRCHCGNISYVLQWPGSREQMTVRVCACTFCTKHGGNWTSQRDAVLNITIGDAALVPKYRFGTQTADFHVCTRCGVVPFVTCEIATRTYAVVNVNTFEAMDTASLPRAPVSFDGEGTGDRLERRQRNWIADVRGIAP
jgi:hypothetical protein